jgi:hypothetical protein
MRDCSCAFGTRNKLRFTPASGLFPTIRHISARGLWHGGRAGGLFRAFIVARPLHISTAFVEVCSMRKSFSLILAVLFVGTVVLAQTTHNNTTEKKASDQITLKADTKVGNTVLKAGRYKIACDTKTVTFWLVTTDVGMGEFTSTKKVLEMPCDGKELTERSPHTELTVPEKAGVVVLEKLTLRGGNVEHVFPN